MSRRRGHTRLTYAAAITWTQIRIVLQQNWRLCLVGATLIAAFSAVLALGEPAKFRVATLLMVKTVDAGKASAANPLVDSDSASNKDLLDRQARIHRVTEFTEELATAVHADTTAKNLKLTWGVGERYRLQLFLKQLGLGRGDFYGVQTENLSPLELRALFLNMSTVVPNYSDNSFEIRVEALDPSTALRVVDYLAIAYVKTSERLAIHDLQTAIETLTGQKEKLRQRLMEAEGGLKQFYKENPVFANEASGKAVSDTAADVKQEFTRKDEELRSNRHLLDFYKKKFTSFVKSVDTTTEVYDKFKQELIELKYKKKKFLFQGYSPENEGIKEIDANIASIEKMLESAGDMSGRNMVSVGHESQLSSKIVELQDTIKRQEIELESVRKRRDGADERNKVMPEQRMLHEDFQREVRISRELFEDVSRRLEIAQMRVSNVDSPLNRLFVPSAVEQISALPALRRILFSFLVGLLFSAAACVAVSLLRRKVVDEANVFGMGLKFAGTLRPGNADRAKVLLNLGCEYKREKTGESSIVLCSSPGPGSINDVLLLTEYLAKQKEKSLFIVVGSMDVRSHFRLISDLGYANVFSSEDGEEFLLQISDEETLYSVQDCLKILEAHYRVKYSMIFMYIQNGADCLVYPFGQQLADKMLLIGPSARYSSHDYFRLAEGFRNTDEVYVALTDWTRSRRKADRRA